MYERKKYTNEHLHIQRQVLIDMEIDSQKLKNALHNISHTLASKSFYILFYDRQIDRQSVEGRQKGKEIKKEKNERKNEKKKERKKEKIKPPSTSSSFFLPQIDRLRERKKMLLNISFLILHLHFLQQIERETAEER